MEMEGWKVMGEKGEAKEKEGRERGKGPVCTCIFKFFLE